MANKLLLDVRDASASTNDRHHAAWCRDMSDPKYIALVITRIVGGKLRQCTRVLAEAVRACTCKLCTMHAYSIHTNATQPARISNTASGTERS
jgi:hypothetical protein